MEEPKFIKVGDEVSPATDAEIHAVQEQLKQVTAHTQTIGRDGAYVEIDASQLATADLSHAKMIVLKAGRIEITDPKCVELLKGIQLFTNGNPPPTQIDNSRDWTVGLTAEQKSFQLFKRIFEAGLFSEDI